MTARRLDAGRRGGDACRPPQLRPGDLVVCEAGDLIPGDGDVVEGVASVDESAITGESAPVIRESGGDRSAVTGGTRVLSDRIVVRITQEPGAELPRPHDRPGRGHLAAQDAERDRPQHPDRRPDDGVPGGHGDPAADGHLRRQRGVADRADRPAGGAHPDHDRRPAVGDRHRRHGPAGAAQRAGHERARGRGGGRRRHAAARQDRHHHARQPPGRRVHPGRRRHRARPGRGGPARLAGRRDPRGALDRGAGQGALRPARARGGRPRPGVRARSARRRA